MRTLYIFLSIFFLLFSLYYFSRLKGRGEPVLAVVLVLLPPLFTLLLGAYVVADWFTGVGFDDSIFYHLRFGVAGAGFSEFLPQIIMFILAQLVGIAISVYYWRARKRAVGSAYLLKSALLGSCLLFCAFFVNPALQNLMRYFGTLEAKQDFSLYFKPNTMLEAATAPPKNILYFYLEGVERTYLDQSLFPGLLPNLARLEAKSVSFTEIEQSVGASWTIAGMVASQCGLPLLSAFTNTSFSMTDFMPNARCLGDLLQQQGYHMEYMGGARTEFAGKGLFYQNHGFERVEGTEALVKQLPDPNYVNGWGLYDDSLYELLSERFNVLSQQQQPFGLFSINIGTHQPDGHIARTCDGIKYGDGSNQLLNAVHCTDRLLGQLFERLEQNPALKNTLVVLASDHLAPPTVITLDQLMRGERRNLLMIIDPDTPPASSARKGTTLDVAPTLLGYLNYGSMPLALGRDLNGPEETLSESFGKAGLDDRLLSWRTTLDAMFWEYPTITGDIQVHPDEHEIQIGDRKFTYPVLLTYDESKKISDMWYSDRKARGMTPAFYLSNMLNNSQTFLWIDTCAQISTLAPELRGQGEAFCYYSGSLAGIKPIAARLPLSSFNISEQINTELSVARANTMREQLGADNLIQWGKDVANKLPGLPPLVPVVLASAGAASINGSSFVNNTASNADITQPGLYLVRVSYRREAGKGFAYAADVLAPLNICQSETAPNIAALMKTPTDHDEQIHGHLLYAIVGNGEAACENGTITPTVDLPLSTLNKLTAGAPYLAVFDEQRNVLYEKLGNKQQTIGVYVNTNWE